MVKVTMNKMQVKAVHEYLLFKEAENPFLKLKSKSGIILAPGLVESRETGDIAELDQIIGFGLVEAVGDQCKYVKVGDGIFYDRRSIRAVPLKETLWQYNERNIIAVVPAEDGLLQEAYAEYYKEKEEALKAWAAHSKQKREQEEADRTKLAKEMKEREANGEGPKLSPLIKHKHGG